MAYTAAATSFFVFCFFLKNKLGLVHEHHCRQVESDMLAFLHVGHSVVCASEAQWASAPQFLALF